jgi:serine/threonine protein kinase
MIVGQFPFRGATDDELYFTINRGQYPKSDLITRPVANLLDKIFVVDPSNRIKASSV